MYVISNAVKAAAALLQASAPQLVVKRTGTIPTGKTCLQMSVLWGIVKITEMFLWTL